MQKHIEAFIIELFKDIVLSSYYICLIGGLIGLVLYIFGCQKTKSAYMVAPVLLFLLLLLGIIWTVTYSWLTIWKYLSSGIDWIFFLNIPIPPYMPNNTLPNIRIIK